MPQRPFALSVKAVIRDGTGQCLVLRRSQQSQNHAGLWDLPGGKCGPGEAIEVALPREVAEETGLRVELTDVVGSAQSDLPDRVVAYLIVEARAADGPVRLSAEHDAHQWQPRHRLAELPFAPQFREFVRSYAQAGRLAGPQRGFDPEWYRGQIQAYGRDQTTYEAMAASLARVLEDAARTLGLVCVVQVRAKSIASFGEKILRPGKEYHDPLRELTDLCGARVITQTLSGVAAFGQFVENHFDVDWRESGDKLESLAASEFGYLSRHYIVSFKEGEFPGLVPAHLARPDLKAEVQVRTILQHAWADINHGLSYKNRFQLPRRWRREFARLAAVLEEADRDFEQIKLGLGEYETSYDAYYTEAQLREEMEKLAIVLREARQPAIAHRLARMAIHLGRWDKAVQELEPFAESGPAALVRDLGISLCKLHGKEPEGPGFARGQALLRRAVELDPTDLDAHASLGGTWRRREGRATDPALKARYREAARDCYRRAFEVDTGHPYPLGNYIEYEIAAHPKVDVVRYFRPSLEEASRRCGIQAEVGVNLPWAYFDLGKFQLMLRDPYAALGHYARGVAASTAPFYLDSALGSFPILEVAELEGLDWARGFLRLAETIRFDQPGVDLPGATPGAAPLVDPVAIVAGYCDRPASDEHRRLLIDAFRGFPGTILSGGTEAGISAAVGELRPTGTEAIRTVGYLPARIPPEVKPDDCYAERRVTSGTAFSPLEPLRYWADLHASGITPDRVRLLALGGGRLAAIECQMALAFGAPVGLVGADGTEVARALAEPPWVGHERLQVLPPDVEAVRRFLGR